jgi:broad specificity phosphatase PhoE
VTKTKPRAQLRDKIEDTPERRILAAQYRRAMDTADALGKLLDECSDPAQPLSATRVEHNEDEYFSALRNYVELLGGELEIKAVFPDRTVTLVPANTPE